jgi:hypothetical protein
MSFVMYIYIQVLYTIDDVETEELFPVKVSRILTYTNCRLLYYVIYNNNILL